MSKNEIFENFTIIINIKVIEEFNLKNDYISIFDKMNKSNSNYSSIFFQYINSNDTKYLEDFNINFEQIKKLTLFQDFSKEERCSNPNDNIVNQLATTEAEKRWNNFFKILFSLNNIGKNLIYLDIDIFNNILKTNKIELDNNSFENLNNFKSLKYLKLYELRFKTIFNLKLINLEYLDIKSTSNIIFTDKIIANLIFRY